MGETVRTSKIEKFVQKKVLELETCQRVINELKRNGADLKVYSVLETRQVVLYNTVFELCNEFNIKMPRVLGVTP